MGTGVNGTGTATWAASGHEQRADADFDDPPAGGRPRRSRRAGREVARGAHQTSSTLSATALPPPRQRVARPVRPPRSRSAWSRVVSTRAPLAPIG